MCMYWYATFLHLFSLWPENYEEQIYLLICLLGPLTKCHVSFWRLVIFSFSYFNIFLSKQISKLNKTFLRWPFFLIMPVFLRQIFLNELHWDKKKKKKGQREPKGIFFISSLIYNMFFPHWNPQIKNNLDFSKRFSVLLTV